jgi:hypothetical protein
MTLLFWLLGLAILAFGLWMSRNAKTGPQDTMAGALIFVGVILLLIMSAISAHAHDHNRPGLDDWFKSLRSKNTVPCCDGSEATRLNDVDWESHDGHYRVKLDGEWVDVPDSALIEAPNLAGQAMVWPYFKDGKLIGVRCFMPGALT